MRLLISSWNMQGGLRDKVANMRMPSSPRILNTNILLVQEEGNPDDRGVWVNDEIFIFGKRFTCIVSEVDPEARVQYRCTTSVLVDDYVRSLRFQVQKISHVGYRPIVGLKIGSVSILTVHDIANGTSFDIKDLINRGLRYIEPWMIMGDINCTPQAMNHDNHYIPDTPVFVNCNTVNRPKGFYEIYPANPTQGRNGSRTTTLDYILASESMLPFIRAGANYHIENEMILSNNGYLSDHNMINCVLDNV